MESPIINRRLGRSNSLTESVNPEGLRLSSPVFYMRNSRKKRNKDSNERRETEEAPEEPTSPVETLKFDDDCMVNMQRPIRKSQRNRMVSSPDYQLDLHQHSASSLGPDNQPSSPASQQHPDGQTHGSEPMTEECDRKNESKYVTMFPRKLGDLEAARGWSNAYANISPVDDETNAAMTAAAVLRDIALNHLTCNLCNQRYRAPKTLNCLHSFCTTCLQSRLDKCPGPWRREIICPICEEVTELSQVNELTGVRDSTQVLALLEDVEKLEECLTGHKMKASVDEVTTIQQVTTDYQKLRVYDPDPSSDNGDGRSGQTTPQEAAVCDAKTCSKHPGKDLKLFCKTCQVMICKDCTLSNHHASSHPYVDATSAVTVCRRHLDTMLPMIQKDCKEFTQAASSARNAYCRLHMNIQASKNKILQVEEREVARVRAHGEQLRKEAIEVGKQNATEIEAVYKSHCDHAQRASHTEGKIKHALTKATSLEILKMKQDLFESITTVMNKKVITQTHDLSFLDFKGHLPNPTADINLGTLLTKEKWKKIIDFGRQPGKGFRQVGFVAVYSNGDVAATDMESWTLTVVKCGHHISHMKRLNELSKKALIRPYAIAINTHDELVVLDNSRVKVLDRQMGFLLQVPTSFPEYPVRNSFGSILSCLAVDRQNRIAVGHRGKEIISLHRRDGSLIQVVPAPMIDTQLTISQQERLVYSNYEARKVLSRDFNGQLVFCVDTDNKLPTGVCCDKAGYIYVAMHTDSAGRCEIHQFDPDGMAIGCVVRGLDNPLGLTFTKDDELVVADKYSVKIYRRA